MPVSMLTFLSPGQACTHTVIRRKTQTEPENTTAILQIPEQNKTTDTTDVYSAFVLWFLRGASGLKDSFVYIFEKMNITYPKWAGHLCTFGTSSDSLWHRQRHPVWLCPVQFHSMLSALLHLQGSEIPQCFCYIHRNCLWENTLTFRDKLLLKCSRYFICTQQVKVRGPVKYLWTLCLGRWIQAPLPAEPLRVFRGSDWWSSWSPHRRAKRSTCMSPVGCGKAPLCSSIKLPPPYLCTEKEKQRLLFWSPRMLTFHQYVQSCWFHTVDIHHCRKWHWLAETFLHVQPLQQHAYRYNWFWRCYLADDDWFNITFHKNRVKTSAAASKFMQTHENEQQTCRCICVKLRF